ncbi:unnamed protein product [Diamesa hyperborea]
MSNNKELVRRLPSTSTFVRNSKMRKSFRVKNPSLKIPPAALIFLKSIEQNKIRSRKNTVWNISTTISICSKIETQVKDSEDVEDQFIEDIDDENQPLLKKTPIMQRRAGHNKLQTEGQLKKPFKTIFAKVDNWFF